MKKVEKLNVIVEISSRHVHLSEADLKALFGAEGKLTYKRELSQPGQYLCDQRVDLVGPKSTMKNVAVLGPVRPATQVEISLTDARALGALAPVRESGSVAGSGVITIEGPCGTVELKEGVIAAKRHIHMTPDDAEKYGLKDKELVTITIEGDRKTAFHETVLRVSKDFRTRLHIDTDEANAAGVSGEVTCLVTKE